MTLSKPQPLTDWSDSQVERFWTDYRAWSKRYPEIAKTGAARVALIYWLVVDELLAPLNAELAEVRERLDGTEQTNRLLANHVPITDVDPDITACPVCGSPRKRITYTTARRGEVTEWRCQNRGKHRAKSAGERG